MRYRAIVSDSAQFSALEPCLLEYISVPINILSKEACYDKSKTIIRPPDFSGGRENEVVEKLKILRGKGFSLLECGGLPHIQMGRELGFELHGGFRLNITNSSALAEYARLGLKSAVLSPEINLVKARHIAESKTIPVGLIIYGNLPMMLLRRCPLSANGEPCGGKRGDCPGQITDRRGVAVQILCNGSQDYVETLNPDALILSDKRAQLDFLDFGTLMFTKEDKPEQILADYTMNAKPAGRFTRGLYYL